MASRPGHREIWFAATAGALLIIAGLHLLPDAWSGARSARIWPGLVPAAAAASFTAAGLPTRAGCGCQQHQQNASGAGTAAALAIHRVLEGSAIALVGTVAVAAALAVHAFAEGLATGALLGAQPRRIAGWLAAICVSPVIGAAVTGAFAVPAVAGPVLLAWQPASSPRRPCTLPAEPCVRSRLTSAAGPLDDVVRGRRWPGRGD